MKTQTLFIPTVDRYFFDMKLGRSKNWHQIDTSDDFQFYGCWANFDHLNFIEFAEGDFTETIFDDLDEMLTFMKIHFVHVDAKIDFSPKFDDKKKQAIIQKMIAAGMKVNLYQIDAANASLFLTQNEKSL